MTVYDASLQDDSNLDVTLTESDDLVTIDINPASFTLTGADAPVDSVNGQTGVVVLDTDDIDEGTTNLYYNDTLVDTYLQSGNLTTLNLDNHLITWNEDEGTFDLPLNANVTLQVGQEQNFIAKNESGTNIANGDVVRVTGVSGTKLTVELADASSETTSSSTIGVATEAINKNATGYITISGTVRGIDTSTMTEGHPIWLGSTPGSFVAGAHPETPDHLVHLGWVTRSHATEGSIYVKVSNGWEIDELHDVLITTKVDGDILVWDTPNSYWKNVPLDTKIGTYLTTNAYATQNYVDGEIITVTGLIPTDINDLTDVGGLLTHVTNTSQLINDSGFLTSYTETDPTVPTHVKNITLQDTNDWDNAFSWGDHSLAGYLTSFTETDPVFDASPASSITAQNKIDWTSAFNWGDHSLSGYLTEANVLLDDGVNNPRMENRIDSYFDFERNVGDGFDNTLKMQTYSYSAASILTTLRYNTANAHSFFTMNARDEGTGDDGSHSTSLIINGAGGNNNILSMTPTFSQQEPLGIEAASINFHGNYTFPTTDGLLDQVMSTDGNGQLSWVDVAAGGGASALGDLTDVVLAGVADGDILRYNGTALEWQNTNLGLTLTPLLSGAATGSVGQSHTVTVTNHASYDDVNYFVEVKDSLGVVQVTNANVTDNRDGTLTFIFPATADTYDIEVTAQDFGDLASDIATQQVSVAALFGWTARYVRVADFTTNNDPNDLMIANLRFYTGTGQTGTALPANMTSATAPSPYVITSNEPGYGNHNFWKAYDSSLSSSFWTLSTSVSVAATWITVDFGSAQTINSMSVTTGNFASDMTNGFTIYTSDTGAFAGEEVQRESLSHSDTPGATTNLN